MKTVYLASPLGFSRELKTYRDRIRKQLIHMGFTVLDPWEQSYGSAIDEAVGLEKWSDRVQAFKTIANRIGKANEEMIRSCDLILGVLDGAELDSGTVSEIGFAAGLGKKCYGLRTDFRNCGDLFGIPFNLQVLYWIESTGGTLFRRIEEMKF